MTETFFLGDTDPKACMGRHAFRLIWQQIEPSVNMQLLDFLRGGLY
jgi:hypothetical protein